MKKSIVVAVLLLLLGGLVYLALLVRQHGFSAQAQPSWLEIRLARHARKIMTPADAKQLRNPFPATAESLAAGREHFADHCAVCHDFDGRGRTDIGRNLYPKAPDMTDAETQGLSDGELFYVIQNGVRFTGMPAWQSEHTPKETWELVAFIRHLPTLAPEELEEMRQAASRHAGGAQAQSGAHRHEHAHAERDSH